MEKCIDCQLIEMCKIYESLEKFQEVIKSSHSIFDSNDNDISQPISDKIEKTLVENCKFVNMDK